MKGRWEVLIDYKMAAYTNAQLNSDAICLLGTTVYIDDPNDNLEFIDVCTMAVKSFMNSSLGNDVSMVSVKKISKMIPGSVPGFWCSTLRD